jgi:hypothetical protein
MSTNGALPKQPHHISNMCNFPEFDTISKSFAREEHVKFEKKKYIFGSLDCSQNLENLHITPIHQMLKKLC